MGITEFICFKTAMFCLKLANICHFLSIPELGYFFIGIGDKIRDIWVEE